jgi:hypothetical protein
MGSLEATGNSGKTREWLKGNFIKLLILHILIYHAEHCVITGLLITPDRNGDITTCYIPCEYW